MLKTDFDNSFRWIDEKAAVEFDGGGYTLAFLMEMLHPEGDFDGNFTQIQLNRALEIKNPPEFSGQSEEKVRLGLSAVMSGLLLAHEGYIGFTQRGISVLHLGDTGFDVQKGAAPFYVDLLSKGQPVPFLEQPLFSFLGFPNEYAEVREEALTGRDQERKVISVKREPGQHGRIAFLIPGVGKITELTTGAEMLLVAREWEGGRKPNSGRLSLDWLATKDFINPTIFARVPAR